MIPTEPSLALLRDVLATGILTDPFMLVDVGASGGIAPWWYAFGAHLRAVGFDPLLAEMQRQQALRPHEGITYVAGAVTYHGYDALCPPALRHDDGARAIATRGWSDRAVSALWSARSTITPRSTLTVAWRWCMPTPCMNSTPILRPTPTARLTFSRSIRTGMITPCC